MQRIIDRLRQLAARRHEVTSRRLASESDIGNLPCSVCGAPASAWEYRSVEVDGSTVIDGSPLCEVHASAADRAAADAG